MSVTFDQRKFLGGSTSTPAGVGPGLYDLAAAYDALAASSKNAASSSFLSKSSSRHKNSVSTACSANLYSTKSTSDGRRSPRAAVESFVREAAGQPASSCSALRRCSDAARALSADV